MIKKYFCQTGTTYRICNVW